MDAIGKAFRQVRRADFLPAAAQYLANYDVPVAIGFGQTNSQPSTVQAMLRWLDPQPGHKVLDVGSGSGWTSALLALLVRPGGRVYAVERIPELVHAGRVNARRAGIGGIRFYQAGPDIGLPRFGPYDRILVSAAAGHLPGALLDQLKAGGKLVIPVRGTILEVNKTPESYDSIEHPGYLFVPLL